MKLRYKIGGGVVAVLAAVVVVAAAVLSYSAPCGTPPAASSGGETMRAAMTRCYGSADIVTHEELSVPEIAADEVLVRVRAAGVNPADWHYMRGSPYLMRLSSGIGTPSDVRMGVDFAGTVAAVGSAVTRFAVGDEVFGGASGAFAEYVTVREDRAIAKKPDNVSFEQAGSVAIAGLTALQALRDKGGLEPGQRVLINGASGGVGTFAVQIAKSMGADVTGVCSTRNVEMVTSIGADRVIDYTKESFTERPERYDLIVDMVGNHPPSAVADVLTPQGTLVIVGGAKGNWIAPFLGPLKAVLLNKFVDQEITVLLARLTGDDMRAMAELMQAGDVTPVIDKRYPLAGVQDAIRYSESGRARGKIALEVE